MTAEAALLYRKGIEGKQKTPSNLIFPAAKIAGWAQRPPGCPMADPVKPRIKGKRQGRASQLSAARASVKTADGAQQKMPQHAVGGAQPKAPMLTTEPSQLPYNAAAEPGEGPGLPGREPKMSSRLSDSASRKKYSQERDATDKRNQAIDDVARCDKSEGELAIDEGYTAGQDLM